MGVSFREGHTSKVTYCISWHLFSKRSHPCSKTFHLHCSDGSCFKKVCDTDKKKKKKNQIFLWKPPTTVCYYWRTDLAEWFTTGFLQQWGFPYRHLRWNLTSELQCVWNPIFPNMSTTLTEVSIPYLWAFMCSKSCHPNKLPEDSCSPHSGYGDYCACISGMSDSLRPRGR